MKVYFAPQSRAVRTVWLLEEIGLLFAKESDSDYNSQKAFVAKLHEERHNKVYKEEINVEEDMDEGHQIMPTDSSLSTPRSPRIIVGSHRITYQSIEDD